MTRQTSRTSDRDRDEARDQLRAIVKPGSTVYTVLRHVSKSGMSRSIALYIIEDGEPRWITYTAARAMRATWDDAREAIKVGGVGMDMGFAIVYDLGVSLFGRDGWTCAGDRCPSNDHSNGDRDHTPHQHSDGGYALQHRWL